MGRTEVDTSKCNKCAHKWVCEKRTCAECDGGYTCDECELYCTYNGCPDVENCENFLDENTLVTSLSDSKKSWVVVYRPEGEYPRVRHIIAITGTYKEEEFKEWYYESFNKLDGDAFKHCRTQDEKQTFLDSLN